MRLLTLTLAVIGLLIVPLTSYAKKAAIGPQSYVELGLGLSQHQAIDKTSTADTLPQSVAAKILIGGKIMRNSNVWFELMYNYDGKTNYSDTNYEFSSQSVSTGLKLTTSPYKQITGFTRFGGGQTRFNYKNNGSSSSGSKFQAYVGTGLGYRLTKRQYFNFEYQFFHHFDMENGAIDENRGSVFLTYQHYLD